MNDIQTISQLGYLAVFTGTAMEGETAVFLAAMAVQMGYLQFPQMVIAALVGAICGDQLFFWLGRLQGKFVLIKFPKLRQKVYKANSLMLRHKLKVLFGYRFIYGLRGAILFTLGMGELKTSAFIVINILSCLLWTIVMSTLGVKIAFLLHLI